MTKLIHEFPEPLVPLIKDAIAVERERHQLCLDNMLSEETGSRLLKRFYEAAHDIAIKVGDNKELHKVIQDEIHSPVHYRQMKAKSSTKPHGP
jgi:hypothetical protein